MSRLSSLSSNPELTSYAQGTARQNISPIADFLAPMVPVSSQVGRFKKFDDKHRFRVPDTRRSIGGRATTLEWNVDDATYNCTPRAIDVPVDKLEALELGTAMNAIKEGADDAAEVAGLSHEQLVINTALAAAGAGTNHNFTSDAVDPVSIIDSAILAVSNRFLTGQGGGPRFMEVPDISSGSVEMLKWLKEEENSYYLKGELADPEAKRARLVRSIGRWCSIFEEMIMLMALNMQHGVDEISLGAVSGAEVNWTIRGEDLQGELDVVVRCDEGSIDPDLAMKKLEMLGKFGVQFDRTGYFIADSIDHQPGAKPVFNRTVALKDSWVKKGGR